MLNQLSQSAEIPNNRIMSEPSNKPLIDYKITPEEMWNCAKGNNQNWGIEGYEIARKYYDYRQVKWLEKRKKILDAHQKVWPPPDWPKGKEGDKQVPPQRINFIDEQIKWAKSFNDIQKSDELKQSLEGRGTFKQPEPKHPIDLRDKFLKDEKDKKEKRDALPKIQPWKENAIEEAKKNLEEAKAKIKTKEQIDLEKHPKDKPLWPRADRVGVLSDAIFVGENLPFYNDAKKDGDDKVKNSFFPKKEITWKRAPVWSFQNKNPMKLPNDNMKSRDEAINNKVESLKGSKNWTDKDLIIDVCASHDKIRKRGRYFMAYHKPFDYANTDQYKLNKEQHPIYSPGPQHYWKMKEGDVNERPKQTEEDKELNGKPSKVYYMNRKRSDFRQSKPLRKSVF